MPLVNAARSVTPESWRRSDVAISHSRRSTFRMARAAGLRRAASSDLRMPQTAWKYGTIRGATNVARPRASLP